MKRGRRQSRHSGLGTRDSKTAKPQLPSLVRIGAGIWKGRRLEVPPGARPTSARAREALFDLLGDWIRGKRVLELYAGSGAVGFEAVSRGAASAVLVDRDARAVERAAAVLDPLRERVRVVRSAASSAVRDLLGSRERFDLVFCDPPYAETVPRKLLRALPELLSSGGRLVIQSEEGDLPEIPGMELRRRRAYGRNAFTFFEKPALEGF